MRSRGAEGAESETPKASSGEGQWRGGILYFVVKPRTYIFYPIPLTYIKYFYDPISTWRSIQDALCVQGAF